MTFSRRLYRDRFLLIMLIPGITYLLIFRYLPMFGIVIAFQNFAPGIGILHAPFVGLKWFKEFVSSMYFTRVVSNTLLLSFYSLLFGFSAPIIFALMLNEMRNGAFKRTVQTISYLPHFISTVVVVGMIFDIFSMRGGIVNRIVEFFGHEPINFTASSEWFRTLYVGSGIWQSMGWNSIIYLAALSGISPSLYEAAVIDGASRFKCLLYITLPSLVPTIVTLLIINMGNVMNVGFEKVYLMYSPVIYDVSDVISTFVYRRGIESTQYSYASAVDLFNSVINFTLVVSVNSISRRVSSHSLW